MSDTPKKPFLGHAVVNGKIRYLSVSQITAYDPSSENGCPRRWYFQKVAGKKELETKAQSAGVSFASQLEHYLKTGVDALEPILRAAKHLFPKPGPDLEVEQQLGDIYEAVRLRDVGESVEQVLCTAGLVAAGIPLMGAADFRHLRGEYVDEDGTLRNEEYPYTVEIGDLKTTARINDSQTRRGDILPGYAKSSEQVGHLIQMLGYGVHSYNKYRGLKYVRLSHIYAQTRGTPSGAKRTILLPVEDVLYRWGRVENVVREMEQAAKATDAKDVQFNSKACRSYNRDCPHLEYCDRPSTRHISSFTSELFQIGKGKKMGLYESLPEFPKELEAPPPFPTPQVEGYISVKGCNGRGFYANENGHGFVTVEPGHTCNSNCAPQQKHGGINPADGPAPDSVAAAAPLPPDIIAQIENPELKAKAEEHARAVTEAPKETTGKKKEKTSGRCSLSGSVSLQPEHLATGKYTCACGKAITIKKLMSADFTTADIPTHNRPKAKEELVTKASLSPPPIEMEILPSPPPPPPFQEPVVVPHELLQALYASVRSTCGAIHALGGDLTFLDDLK